MSRNRDEPCQPGSLIVGQWARYTQNTNGFEGWLNKLFGGYGDKLVLKHSVFAMYVSPIMSGVG